jgi:putative transposase
MEASMARLARVVIPGLPHHVTQRGNRREAVFFGDDDYGVYLDLIGQAARRAGTEVWAYCLMPNHVHFIMAPAHQGGLRAAFAEAHRRYTGRINARLRQTGHLWQGRFGSVVMDERHLLAAARYVAMNPVAAGLVAAPQDWPWSSVRAHLSGRDDGLVTTAPLLRRVGDFAAFLGGEGEGEGIAAEVFERASGVGRPLGAAAWQAEIERLAGRSLAPRKRGPKPKGRADGAEGDLFSKLSPQ